MPEWDFDDRRGWRYSTGGRPVELAWQMLSLLSGEQPAPDDLTTLEHDLVDVLRMKILPVVLGAGGRLFGETSGAKAMRLVNAQSVEGVAVLTYERVRDTWGSDVFPSRTGHSAKSAAPR